MTKKIPLILFTLVSFVFAQNIGLNFDGVDDFVATNVQGPSGNTSRTIEVWIKTTKNSLPTGQGGLGQSVIVDWGSYGSTSAFNGQRFTFNLLFNNAIRIEVAGNGLSGTIPVNDGLWHHVAAVYDAVATTNKVKLYVDGVLDNQGNLTVTVNTGTANNITIGKRIDNTGYFDGDIDDVRIYNVARDSTSIYSDFTQQLCLFPADLIHYFKLNEGVANGSNTSNNTCLDYITNTVGNLYNFALTDTVSNWVAGAGLSGGNTYSSESVQLCSGTYLSPSGNTYSSTGIYYDTLTNAIGCDSIITTDLYIGNTYSNFSIEVCESYISPSGGVYTNTGTIQDTIGNSVGCDSVMTIDLSILLPTSSHLDTAVCNSYTYNNVTYTANTFISDTLTNSAGCDSIYTINLTVNNDISSSETISACDSVVYGGTTYTNNQVLSAMFTSASGCDSIHTVNIIIQGNRVETSETVSACDSLEIDGTWYTQSQQIILNEASVTGCDSTHTIILTVISIDTSIMVGVLTSGGNMLSANQENAAYEWFNCSDNTSTGNTNQSVQTGELEEGSYYVVTTLNGCSSSSDCYSLIGTGIQDLFNSNFELYPNPNNGQFTINLENHVSANSFAILDIVGKTVYTKPVDNVSSFTISNNLEKGLYYIIIETNDGKYANRFMVR